MARFVLACVAFTALVASVSTAEAQSVTVALPAERADELATALRVELDRSVVLEVVDITRENRANAEGLARTAARAAHSTRVSWFEFASGELRPPTMWLDTEPSTTRRSQILSEAMDVVAARVFALSFVSFLEAPAAVEPVAVAEPEAPVVEPVVGPSPEVPAVTGPRRRVSIASDRAVWSTHLGGELSYATLRNPAVFSPAVSFGLAGYVAQRWRIDGDLYFMFLDGSPLSMRGGVGVSYFTDNVASQFQWLAGARILLGVYENPGWWEAVDAHGYLGGGVFAGAREHLGAHWALEERLGVDVVGRFGVESPLAAIPNVSVHLEYVF